MDRLDCVVIGNYQAIYSELWMRLLGYGGSMTHSSDRAEKTMSKIIAQKNLAIDPFNKYYQQQLAALSD